MRRHCRSVKKYFLSKSGPDGDSSRGASNCAPEMAKIEELPPPPEPPKWHFFGRSRGHGAHDNVGTWPRAREKRGTKRTTRDREEQLEVRGAFCFPFLARARAYSVGTGAPACTDRPRQGRGYPSPAASNLAPGATFGAAAVPRGLTSRELTVPSKGCRPQKKKFSDTLLCSIFATTPPFGQKIFSVQKWPAWGQLARCQRSYTRNHENGGHAPPPEPPK